MEYSRDYLEWKGWHNFGTLLPFERIYFGCELKKSGIPSSIKNVLEIGFGAGKFLAYGKEKGWNISGTELNPYLLGEARKNGFAVVERIEDIADGSLDFVAAFDVLEHIAPEHLERFLALIKSKLRSGGKFLARFPNGDSPLALRNQNADPTHLNFIGSGKAEYYAKALDFPLCHLSGQAAPLFCGDLKLFAYRLYSTPLKLLVEIFVRLLFFPKTKVNWTSPNLVVAFQKK